MGHDEYFFEINNSKLKDWSYDDVGVYLYKKDSNIIIKKDIRWLEIARDTNYVEWSSLFHSNNAYKKRFFLKYRENIMKILYGVFVDGCRCFIPYPDKSMRITKEQYRMGKIINGCLTSSAEFDSYLKQANINILTE